MNKQKEVEIKGSLETVITETMFILACIDDKMREKKFTDEKRLKVLNKLFIDAIGFNDTRSKENEQTEASRKDS